MKTVAQIAFRKRKGLEFIWLLLQGHLHDFNINTFYKGQHFPGPETHVDLLLMARRKDFLKSCQKYNFSTYAFEIHLKACHLRQDEEALQLLFKHTNIRANTFSNKDPQELAKLVFSLSPEFQTPELAQKLLNFFLQEEKSSTASSNKPGYLIQAEIEKNEAFVLWLWSQGGLKNVVDCPYYEKLRSHLRYNQSSTAKLITHMMGHPSSHQKLLWTQKAQQLENTPHHILWPKSG